jgi:wobble nucleotide-excising tRNase
MRLRVHGCNGINEDEIFHNVFSNGTSAIIILKYFFIKIVDEVDVIATKRIDKRERG